jgi:subtilisin family serine protease
MPAINSGITRALFPLIAAALLVTACDGDSTAPRSDGGRSDTPGEPSTAVESVSSPESGTAAEPGDATQDGEAGIVHLGAAPEAGAQGASLSTAGGSGPVRGQYIVVFKDEVQDVPGLSKRLTSAHGGSLRHVYSNALKGFAARLPEQAAAALARHPQVSYVEQDQLSPPSTIQTLVSGQPWGIDRIDQRSGLSSSYTYSHTGSGIYAYIIDTGLDSDHPDFGGRARNVATAFADSGEDCMGHGTHVAGTVGGSKWGVAKRVSLRGVKIGRCGDGRALTSDAIAAFDWVRAHHANPAVANLSYGFPLSSALNTAANNLASSGVFVAVAAGNDNVNACNASPAAASAVFTTAAAGSSLFVDDKASFSNWGSCVDGYAPGYAIRSDKLGGGAITLNGTSMAAPHVAGVAALLKQAYGNKTSSWITSTIKSWATQGAIRGNHTGTPNLLLFKGAL